MSTLRILAILTLRNEAAFLIDWLAHHRAIGVTDFLICSNDCQDGTDTMLDRLQAMGWLTHLPNPGPHRNGPQWDALKRADAHPLRTAADWIITLDIDEYVNVHVGDRSVPALLDALPEATAIPLTWRLFGNAGIARFQDRPITQMFTRAAPRDMIWPWRASLFKTLFRNDGTYRRLGVHRPRQPDPARLADARWFDGSGRPLSGPFLTSRLFSTLGQDNHALVQLNHYALGAMDSYVLKCDRGRANRDTDAFDLSVLGRAQLLGRGRPVNSGHCTSRCVNCRRSEKRPCSGDLARRSCALAARPIRIAFASRAVSRPVRTPDADPAEPPPAPRSRAIPCCRCGPQPARPCQRRNRRQRDLTIPAGWETFPRLICTNAALRPLHSLRTRHPRGKIGCVGVLPVMGFGGRCS